MKIQNIQDKLWHVQSIFKILWWKFLYGKAFSCPILVMFRKSSCLTIGGGKIKIGKGCFFNQCLTIASKEYIEIGENSLFGPNVSIFDNNHCYSDATKTIKSQGFSSAPVKIGNNCWIAAGVTILKGVTIGDHCVIGAGVTVYKDVPADTVLINKQEIISKSLK